MRLVKLSDLSEEERQKVLEEQEARINRNKQASEQIRIDANNKFNEYTSKSGSYDTTKHTTSMNEIIKAKKNDSKESANEFKKANKLTLWDTIKQTANDLSNTTKNFGLSMQNGVKYWQQDAKRRRYEMNNPGAFQKQMISDITNKKTGLNSNLIQSLLYNNNERKEKQKLNNNQNKIQDKIDINKEKIQENTNNISNKILKKANENIIPSLGQMSVGMIGSAINPGLGILYMTGSASGQYYEDAKQRGMNETDANIYSDIMGMMEGVTEQIGIEKLQKAGKGVKALVKGTGKETLKQGTKEITKSSIKSVLKDYGIGIADNVMQEAIIDPIQELTAQTIAGKDKAQWDGIGQRMLQDGINGGLVSAILGGANLGIQSCTGVVEKLHSNQKITGQEIQNAVKDASQKLDTSKMMVDSVEQQVNKYKDYYTGKELDNNSQNVLNQAQNIINNNQNLQPNTTQNQLRTQEQQIIPTENKNVQKENMGQINNIANNQETLYNNTKESESGYNERNNGQTFGRNDETTRIYEKNEPQQTREYSWEEYNKWEKSVKPIETSKLTDSQRKSVEYAKKEYNKDIVLYDENENSNTYSGGASKEVKGKITISKQAAEEFGLNKIIDHENLESDILHNENTRDILSDVIEMIQKDKKFDLQKEEFWKGQEGNIPTDYLIAKDIICDRFSEIRQKEKLDYENVLSNVTKSTIDNALVNYYSQVYGKELDISSSFNLPTKQDVQKNILPTQGEKINWNEVERPEGKIRKHYRSIMESGNTTAQAKAIAKEMMGIDTYVPDSNNKQLERANSRIENSSPDAELQSLMARAKNGDRITATDIAVGEKLIQYYSLIGDKSNLQEAIQATAMAGTTAGQTVQAMSLLNHQTPEGQAIWLQKSVEKINNDLIKSRGKDAEQFNLTEDMIDKIVKSKDSIELENNLNEVYKELGQQVSKSTMQKIDSWRYFSMLANPRTHIRNIVGNLAMGQTQQIKNKIAGIIEAVVSKTNPEMERTHTIVPASKEVKEFAKNDIVNVADRLGLNENKYNPKSRLENSMRTFDSEIMENTLGKLFNLNDTTLEAEDGWGLKAGYKKALSEYMTANNLTPENITDKQLSKARNYAVEQAKIATFHQESKLASLINQLSHKNKFSKYVTDAVVPFVKTPINVAKAGLEYNPVGLIKSMVLDTAQLRKGNITINQYIDNISKGLTGTGIALIGYALADSGVLKASGSDDDDKETYDESRGLQTYSIQIGDNTYSLDWLAPTGIPLFVGAELAEIVNAKKIEKNSSSTDEDSTYSKILDSGTNLLNALANSMNPMTEMSMLSGLTSALSSYEQGSSQMLASIGTNSLKSYVNQFVPTALGQIAKTTDEYERSTTSTKSGVLSKAVDSTKNQIMSKIPGLRQLLPTKTDIWGNNIKQAENVVQRALENAVFPYTRKEVSNTEVDKALLDLYEQTGENSVLPDIIDKTFKIDGQTYRMTADEYSKYKKSYGQTSYNLINNLVTTQEYKNLTTEQKQKAIESIYSYAKESNKINYAETNKLEVEQSTLYKTIQDLKVNGGNQSSYLSYLGKTVNIEKSVQKNQILLDANYTEKTKEIIYRNTTGKEDNLYDILSNGNINIDEYLEYKIKESEGEFSADKDSDGNSISGTSKTKYYNYVNNSISGVGNRLIILGSQYKLQDSERTKLYNYVISLNLNKEKNEEIFSKFKGFTVYKNGTVKY